MFCPNCGTKNDGVELPCKKCGFKLSGAAVAPKFRGTMMLHAEQSVQELIDEHRRNQGELPLPEAPATAQPGYGPEGAQPVPPRSGAPLFGMPGTPQAAVQPPRAGLPQRRMGTMMGVAPQVGGVQPPEDPPLAGAAPEPASLGEKSELVAGRTEAFEAVPVAPLPPTPAAEAGPDPAAASAAPAAPSPAPRRTESLDSVAAPARKTEPLDSVAPPDGAAPPAQRRRVRPLDIFLILITFGLYGFVLLARQRPKRPGAD